MQNCKYNNFDIRFFSHNEELIAKKKYDFCIYEQGIFNRELIFTQSKNQLIFHANEHLQELGNCKKFIIVKSGVKFNLCWTSLKGEHELYDMRGGKKELFDYLFLTFQKKEGRCLYIGSSYEAPLAGWRNAINVDVIYEEASILDKFLKNTTEQYLPF